MTRIDHLNIVVGDMERSLRFYEDVFGWKRGFEAVLEGEWIETVTGIPGARARCVFLEAEGSPIRLEMLQYETPRGVPVPANSLPNTPGLRHLAFVVDDMDAVLSRLEDAGVDLVGPPVTVPFSVGTMGRKCLCYFLDPDGTLLEAAAYGP